MRLRYFQLTVDPNGVITIPESFAPGTVVDVYLVDAAGADRESLARRWEALALRIGQEQDVSKWTDEAIQAEIDAYRRGE